jgi:hypothetical protein
MNETVRKLMIGDNEPTGQQKSQILVERWEATGLLKGLNDPVKKANIATLLEQQARQLRKDAGFLMQETTATGTAAGAEAWSNVALPLVRRVFGNLIANEIVSVQPITLPSGLVFYLDFTWGSTNPPAGPGSTSATPVFPPSGTSVYGNTTASYSGSDMGSYYGTLNFGYSQNYMSASSVLLSGAGVVYSASWADVEYDTGLSSSIAGGGGLLKIYIPSSSLSSSDKTSLKAISIDGAGIDGFYRRFTKFNTATNNYEFIVSCSAIPAAGILSASWVSYIRRTTQDVRGDFEYGKPQVSSIPEINMSLRSVPVVAKTRRLKAIWTPESQQDIAAYHNADVEAELTTMLSEIVGLDIDREIISDILDRAGSAAWWSRNIGNFVKRDGSVQTGTGTFYGTQREWYETLVETINEMSNLIYKKTLRGSANWIVTSPEICSMLEATLTFRLDSVGEGTKTKFNLGMEKAGTLSNRWTVYKDPYLPSNKILIGFKGNSFLETGYVYAPYIPFALTPTIFDPDNFVPRKGIMTRYDKIMIRNDFFATITVRDMRW